MSAINTTRAGPAPAGLEAPCAYLEQVLRFHAANGGPFPRSAELEYAARRLARAWLAARLPERALPPWLALAAEVVFGAGPAAASLTQTLRTWAVDECLLVPIVPPTPGRAGDADA
jgi:hypothetical protein